MLQILNNIYQPHFFGFVSHAGNATEHFQDSTLQAAVIIFSILFVAGGIALGCYVGHRNNSRAYHQFHPEYRYRGDGSGPRPVLVQAEAWSNIVAPSTEIYLLIDGEEHGPYTEEEVRQSLAGEPPPPDLYAWREGLPEGVQVQSLVKLPLEALPVPIAQRHSQSEAVPGASRQTTASGSLLEPKVVDMLMEMTRRKAQPAKRK